MAKFAELIKRRHHTMSNLTTGIALSALAKELCTPIPQLIDALKSAGMCPSSVASAEGLPLLSQEQSAYLRSRFGGQSGQNPVPTTGKGFAPQPSTKSAAPLPTSHQFKSVEQLASQLKIRPSEAMRLINLTATAWNIGFSGAIDDNWEFLIAETRKAVLPELGGTGTQTAEQYINACAKELEKLNPEISAQLSQQTAEDEAFAIGGLGDYLGEVAAENLGYHEAITQQFVLNQADAIVQQYDQSRLFRATLVAAAQKLQSRTESLRERNLLNAGKSIADRLTEVRTLATRISQVALAPVASDKANALAIRAAIAASNRP